MRSDMAKVIVERPRHGSRSPSQKKGYRKYIQGTAVEDLPRCEPLPGRWKGRQKWLNEHLGPMRRFLRSNVGRPWNCVHKDLCEHVSFDNAVQGHVLAHIHEYVSTHVEVHDSSTVYSQSEWRVGIRLRANAMYVCPTTGILKVVQSSRRIAPTTRVAVGNDVLCLWRDNAWWEVRVRSKENVASDRWDVWLERSVSKLTEQECELNYGSNVFATSKRPLKSQESRKLYKKIRQTKRKKAKSRYGV